jgi:hypothetical protein
LAIIASTDAAALVPVVHCYRVEEVQHGAGAGVEHQPQQLARFDCRRFEVQGRPGRDGRLSSAGLPGHDQHLAGGMLRVQPVGDRPQRVDRPRNRSPPRETER